MQLTQEEEKLFSRVCWCCFDRYDSVQEWLAHALTERHLHNSKLHCTSKDRLRESIKLVTSLPGVVDAMHTMEVLHEEAESSYESIKPYALNDLWMGIQNTFAAKWEEKYTHFWIPHEPVTADQWKDRNYPESKVKLEDDDESLKRGRSSRNISGESERL